MYRKFYKKVIVIMLLVLLLCACSNNINDNKIEKKQSSNSNTSVNKSIQLSEKPERTMPMEIPQDREESKIIKLDDFPYKEPDKSSIEKSLENHGVYYTGTKIDNINKTLGIEFKKELSKICELIDENDSENKNILVQIQEPLKMNFSHNNGISEDYAFIVDVSGYLDSPIYFKYLLVFIKDKDKDKYELKLVKESAKYGFTGGFIDVDSDSKKEIAIEMPVDKYNSFIEILRYTGTNFDVIFKEDLHSLVYNSPFKYNNSYDFVERKNNPKLLDIVFNIQTTWDEEEFKNAKDDFYRKKYASDKPVEFNDEIVFYFDGIKYVANKQVYNFKKYVAF